MPPSFLRPAHALSQLAYRLAVEKHCQDLTLEDPSPQLQRVREKLEIEMILTQAPWVMERVQEVGLGKG